MKRIAALALLVLMATGSAVDASDRALGTTAGHFLFGGSTSLALCAGDLPWTGRRPGTRW